MGTIKINQRRDCIVLIENNVRRFVWNESIGVMKVLYNIIRYIHRCAISNDLF